MKHGLQTPINEYFRLALAICASLFVIQLAFGASKLDKRFYYLNTADNTGWESDVEMKLGLNYWDGCGGNWGFVLTTVTKCGDHLFYVDTSTKSGDSYGIRAQRYSTSCNNNVCDETCNYTSDSKNTCVKIKSGKWKEADFEVAPAHRYIVGPASMRAQSWPEYDFEPMIKQTDGSYKVELRSDLSTSDQEFKLNEYNYWDSNNKTWWSGCSVYSAKSEGVTITLNGENNGKIKLSSTDYTNPVYLYIDSDKKIWAVATCKSANKPTPTTTDAPTSKGYTSATMTGLYPTSGKCSVTEKGICYGTSSGNTDKHIDDSSATGSISYSATDLVQNTTYYYRAYVVVCGETLYGTEYNFTTKQCTAPTTISGSFSDQDKCKDASTTALSISSVSGGVEPYSYQWYYHTAATGTGTSLGSSYRGTSYSPPTGTVSDKYYYCVVKSGGECESANKTKESSRSHVVINANAALTKVSLSNSSICLSGTSTATATGAVLGGGTGAWSKSGSAVASVTNTDASSTVKTSTVTASSSTSGDATITYTITNGCDATAHTKTATISKSATLTVKPDASLSGATISFEPSGETCNGNGARATIDGVVLGGGTGAWSRVSGTGGSAIDATTGVITGVTTGTSGSHTFRYTITGGCSGTQTKDGSVTLGYSPILSPVQKTVKAYEPVSITSTNANITEWSLSTESSTNYLYDTGKRSAKFKGAPGTYTIKAAASATGLNCPGSATITVEADNDCTPVP